MSGVPSDYLFVGDSVDSSIKRYDADTGALVATTVPSRTLHGPQGMVLVGGIKGDLQVVNQNVNMPINGEILRFNALTGAPDGAVVAFNSPYAPFAPRGMVTFGPLTIVSDYDGNGAPAVAIYNAGAPSAQLVPDNLASFHPRGVVFGPDGDLYVTSFDPATFDSFDPAGAIVHFDRSGHSTIVAINNGDGLHDAGEIGDLHNPEGIVFGADGMIYVTSSHGMLNDTDKILVIDPATGKLKDEIPLDEPYGPVSYSQAILFGPGGKLYVSIGGGMGEVRRYDVTTKQYDVLVQPVLPIPPGPGLPLPLPLSPEYMTFGQTDPMTLAYEPEHNFELLSFNGFLAGGADVDGDGTIAPIDALDVIDYLNAGHESAVAPTAVPGGLFFDVNGDNSLSPIDALTVINLVNSTSGKTIAQQSALPSLTPPSVSFATAASQPSASDALFTDLGLQDLGSAGDDWTGANLYWPGGQSKRRALI